MKKTSILYLASLVAIVIFWSWSGVAGVADGAAEPFFGEWQYRSVIYTFEPAQAGQIVGQGKITLVPSSEQSKQYNFPFLYIIERKITAESSIDVFWEYILKIWFPSQDEIVKARISFSEGKVSISEGDRKVTVVSIVNKE